MTRSDVTRIVVCMLLGCVAAATASPALAQFTADGRLDEEALLVPTVIDGRIGYAAFVVDTSPEGGDPGVDGFRDGPFSPTLIPAVRGLRRRGKRPRPARPSAPASSRSST